MTDFEAAMSDDLNTPRAMAAFFKIIKMAEKAEEGKKDLLLSLKQAMLTMDKVLGLFYEIPVTYFSQTLPPALGTGSDEGALGCACCSSPISSLASVASDDRAVLSTTAVTDANTNANGSGNSVVMEEVKALAEERARLKAEKRYAEADAIRQLIKGKGFDVKDSKDGYSLSPISSSL